jgi:DNA-binding transcriptional LysR family regulator
MSVEPNWEWYRAFLMVLETGSLSAAGRGLGLTQPTVGRQIDQLEQALGLKLFMRSFDGYSPTEAAHDLKPYAAAIASNAAALQRIASSHGAEVKGVVRITASEVIGVEVLPPILTKLRRQYPLLTVELVLSNQVDNLLHRAADIAIRMVKPEQDALIAKRIGMIELGLHAHRDYLKSHGKPKTMADLLQHAVISYDQETAYIRRFHEAYPMFRRHHLAFRADSDLAQLAAIRAGYGIGICQIGLAARDRNLARVLKDEFSIPLDTWVVMHEDLRNNPRCAVTYAALAEGLSAYVAGSSG